MLGAATSSVASSIAGASSAGRTPVRVVATTRGAAGEAASTFAIAVPSQPAPTIAIVPTPGRVASARALALALRGRADDGSHRPPLPPAVPRDQQARALVHADGAGARAARSARRESSRARGDRAAARVAAGRLRSPG